MGPASASSNPQASSFDADAPDDANLHGFYKSCEMQYLPADIPEQYESYHF